MLILWAAIIPGLAHLQIKDALLLLFNSVLLHIHCVWPYMGLWLLANSIEVLWKLTLITRSRNRSCPKVARLNWQLRAKLWLLRRPHLIWISSAINNNKASVLILLVRNLLLLPPVITICETHAIKLHRHLLLILQIYILLVLRYRASSIRVWDITGCVVIIWRMVSNGRSLALMVNW
jgi:hypothetical protein